MSWRVDESDRWGPVRIVSTPAASKSRGEAIILRGKLAIEAGYYCAPMPLPMLKDLLRAHDLRTKAPGTECLRCEGVGTLDWDPPDCPKCHGSGRNLTPEELKRWREKEGTLVRADLGRIEYEKT